MTPEADLPRRRSGRWRHRLGTLLVVLGIGVLAWVLVVWQWNDPFTSIYTRYEQHRLDDQLDAKFAAASKRPTAVPADPAEATREIRRAADRLRRTASEGEAIGRISVPRLGLEMVVVNGTEPATLKKGPGRETSTSMPGQGGLVYVAGHRTTYLAPFARIDQLRPGDRVTLEMPYGTFVYRVTGHRVVDDQDLSVLRSRGHEEIALQACHPRFFATQRYIVWARAEDVRTAAGDPATIS